jgi:hypothetical protein
MPRGKLPNEMNAQAELFGCPPVPPSQKLFRGANGVELPYWEEDGKIIRVALSDKLILPVTHQKGGHIYANDPGGWGRIERKNKISFLSAAAQIRRAIELNNSMQDSLKEQRELLHAALETPSPSSAFAAVGGRKRDATAEFSHREFGPVITSFEGIEEYPLGTPSWLARRPELEWSRKSLYGQLRRWFGVLRSGCTLVKCNERVGDQIGLSRKTVGQGLEELKELRLIHIEGPSTGARNVYFHRHPWMESPEAVPTWAKLGQVAGPNSPISCPKLGHKETSKDDDQNKERILAPNGEEVLLARIGEIVGHAEMVKNGGMWRKRIRGGVAERLALRNTIEDYNVRTPELRAAIRKRAAWFTDRYLRNLVAVAKTK